MRNSGKLIKVCEDMIPILESGGSVFVACSTWPEHIMRILHERGVDPITCTKAYRMTPEYVYYDEASNFYHYKQEEKQLTGFTLTKNR